MSIELYENPPSQFAPQMQIAACYLEFDGRVLLLERASHKVEGNKWGVPAGKLETNEDPKAAAVRELFEETGIVAKEVRPLGNLYIRKGSLDYIFHMFKVDLREKPEVKLSDEHVDYQWTSPQDREALKLVPGAKEALQFYYKSITNNQ